MKFSELLESSSEFVKFIDKQAKEKRAVNCKTMFAGSSTSDVITIEFKEDRRPDDSFKDFYDFLETRFEYLKFKNTGRNKGFKTVIFSITVDVNQSYFKKYCKSINDAVSQME
jgi:hypothetical protein